MIRKTFFMSVILILILASKITFAQNQIEWIFDIDKAKELTQSSNKPLMIVAMTEWDDMSRSLLDETFKDEAVIRLSRGFVCLQVSILNKDFIKKLDLDRYPTIIFLKMAEDDLKEIDRIDGYREADFVILKMKSVLQEKDTFIFLKQKADDESFNKLAKKEQIETLKKIADITTEYGKFFEAKDYYQRLREIDKKNDAEYKERIDYIRALIYIEQMKTDSAIPILEKMDNKDANYQLIRCYLMDNNFDKALPLIEKFSNDWPLDEKTPFLLDTAASFYFKVGHFKKGLNNFMRVIKNYPDSLYSQKAQNLIETMLVWPSRRQELFIQREIEDTIVIAPDIKTYLYHISLWTDKKIYPVLLKDSRLNDKFIKAFKPKEVKEVESILLPGPIDNALLYRTLYTSWTDDDLLTAITKDITEDNIKEHFKSRDFIPLGIVLTNVGDGQMPGALALASARTQILDFLPYTAKGEKTVDFKNMRTLKQKITDIIKRWEYPHEGFLDGIDYITIAGDFPYAYNYYKTTSPGRYSLDDALGRDDNNQRYAYVGRLVGDWDMSIYQAMCSIFLQPEDALFFNTYSHIGNWREYRTDLADQLLSGILETTNIENKAASLERWHILTESGGNEYDLVFMNSSGGPGNWSTSTEDATVEDIPQTTPAVVVYTHSNSAVDPYDENTICGRWLENGAYVYFGAVSEPYVQSFNTSYAIVTDLLFGRTFSQSLRRDSGPWSQPWRLIYIGDPMYSLTLRDINYQGLTTIKGE